MCYVEKKSSTFSVPGIWFADLLQVFNTFSKHKSADADVFIEVLIQAYK